MSRQTIKIWSEGARSAASRILTGIPIGWIVEFKEDTRSLEQNRRMWAMLKEVSNQVEWYGTRLTDEEWKDVFSAAIKKAKVVPGIDGGFVVLGQRTSRMTVKEMSDLMMLMEAFGAEQGVQFSAPDTDDGRYLKVVEAEFI